LMYSSGTTGRPKGVIITHGMLMFSSAAGVGPGRSTPAGRSLAAMPLFHIAAMNVSCLPALTLGGSVAILRAFEPGAVLKALGDADLGITHFFAVPAAFNAMSQHPLADSTDYSRLVTVISGAEAVPPALVEWWKQYDVRLQVGYGLTETAGQGCLLSHDDVWSKTPSAGKSLIHSRMKIMCDETREAEPDESGEIWIRGGVVTPGYWNNEVATKEAFVGDWFRTGDIGRCDKDGFFYIEDRLKDMYISGGENVYPVEIENVLYEMDAIREVCVIGVTDKNWGETGCVVAAPHEGKTISLEAILDHCRDRLAKYKLPSHLVTTDVLPRNATGKVLKYQLRQAHKDIGTR